MTLKWVEGFDDVSSTTLLQSKGWAFVAGPSGTVAFAAGRINGQKLSMTRASGQNASQIVKNMPAASATVVLGFAFQFTVAPIGVDIIAVMRAGVTNTVQIGFNATSKLVIQNSGGTTIATGTTTFNQNTWYYIEVKVFINGASGTVACQLNGVSEIGSTTGNFGSTNLDNIQMICGGFINRVDYDDIYADDGTTFLGDCHVETLYPSADGNYGQWTPDSGTPHFSRVNESSSTFPDSDTSYVSDSTSGHRDSYVFTDLTPLTGTVFGVQLNMFARKDDAGTRQIASFVRQSSTDYDGATSALATTYSMYQEMRLVDPSTSAAWVISGVNSAEFGAKTI